MIYISRDRGNRKTTGEQHHPYVNLLNISGGNLINMSQR